MLLELGLLSFNTLIHNAKLSFQSSLLRCDSELALRCINLLEID